MIYDIDINERTRRVEVTREGAGFIVAVDGKTLSADVASVNGAWSLVLSELADGDPHIARHSHEVSVLERQPGELTVHVNGRAVPVTVASGRGSWARRGDAAAAGKGPAKIQAPMPGKVVKVLVKVGDTVTAKQGVVVVEAMKMENELKSPKAGTVSEVRAVEGTSVEAGAVLLVVE